MTAMLWGLLALAAVAVMWWASRMDWAALLAMIDPANRDSLIRYNEAVARLMDPVWEREYLGNGKKARSGGG